MIDENKIAGKSGGAGGSNRRNFLKAAAGGAVAATVSGCSEGFDIAEFFQSHYRKMDEEEKKRVVERLERKYAKKYGSKQSSKFKVKTTPPIENTLYAYGLDISRCIGCRRCVYACVKENNLSRDPQIHYITVLRFKKGESGLNVEKGEKYYNPEKVPEDGYFYMPVQCQQCENSPCERVCPTKATWKEKDGVVVIDYNWCIGCRYCMASCPYGARKFNLTDPDIPKKEVNTDTHYLGNRPRYRGVVEKCTFCLQRIREGLYPACVEICPVGARKFGNILDPDSEIRYIFEEKRVFRLKEEINTLPKFFYFYAT
jgi:molybdopterin-containing oxidoreductase family iron-sulfur binding subunit